MKAPDGAPLGRQSGRFARIDHILGTPGSPRALFLPYSPGLAVSGWSGAIVVDLATVRSAEHASSAEKLRSWAYAGIGVDFNVLAVETIAGSLAAEAAACASILIGRRRFPDAVLPFLLGEKLRQRY